MIETTKKRRYFAADADHAAELTRLRLLEELLDPLTQRRMQRIGVAPGWCCLLVGAGRGSIAGWLEKCVGPTGRVVAIDKDTRFLSALSSGIEVRQLDILRDALETDSFDLVHCRCLLMHLDEPSRALRKMVDVLKPGGWLLVEEPDDTAVGPVDLSYPGADQVQRANQMMLDALQAMGVMDPFIGRQLRDLLSPFGLEDIQCEGVSWLHRGGDVAARLIQATLPLHVAAGRMSSADAANYKRMLGDPGFAFVDSTWVGAKGRRPGHS